MNRLVYLLPLLTLGVVAGFAIRGLTLDQTTPPSAMLAKPVPDLTLEAVPGYGQAFDERQLLGQVSLINVFGSWCAFCEIEHPFLMELAAQGAIPIYGLNWRDEVGDGAAWLDRHGSPYSAVGADRQSRAVLDLGVTGAPETFLVDREGVIRYRHAGPVTPRVWRQEFMPRIEALETAPAAKAAGEAVS